MLQNKILRHKILIKCYILVIYFTLLNQPKCSKNELNALYKRDYQSTLSKYLFPNFGSDIRSSSEFSKNSKHKICIRTDGKIFLTHFRSKTFQMTSFFKLGKFHPLLVSFAILMTCEYFEKKCLKCCLLLSFF